MALKKLAIFAEGGTEQHFIDRLIRAIATERKIKIELTKRRGGSLFNRHAKRLLIDGQNDDHQFYIQIVDCGNDERVQSDIRELYERLVQTGFNAIIGIRDVHPKSPIEIAKLKQYLYYKIKTVPISPVIVLAIMEIEAWFLAEHTHFAKIDGRLTLDTIKNTLSFNPETENVEGRLHPSADLDQVYRVAGQCYEKTAVCIQRTINALDMDRLYLELPERLDPLKNLISAIEEFFAPDLSPLPAA